ncbi:DNA-directed RNA polymerase subunit beta' [Candidatus Dojkabacteria bacterium]|nr:DNA-directed RNA polymerase subunit beta' [Candidatus Dojkabacteria bacterium]
MEPNNNQKKKKNKFDSFDAIKVTLASPEQILSWSHGEITKAETINYRTLKPEPDGLMCEKIFGPSKNYECYCGKYRKVRYKGIICDKCGVEVTTNKVRRERMGHIKLCVPVTHVWYSFSVPNKIATILDISQKKLLSVVYYTRYLITDVDGDQKKEILPAIDSELETKKKELQSELDVEVQEKEKELSSQIKKIQKKSDSKSEFQIETLTHENKKTVAKLHKQFADREEELEKEYDDLKKLVEKIAIGEVLSEEEFILLKDREYVFFTAKMGAEAVRELLVRIDLKLLRDSIQKSINLTDSVARRSKLVSRIRLVDGFLKNNLRPEWMILDVVPVIPPDLRPIIQLPGGKFATSDLNDLYRRVINRNNRLKRLIEIGAPEVILRNEKRMLQESVDALIDNSHRPSRPILSMRRLPYKALTDNLRGKKGRFRRNLLGKRVDYSGRSVIIGSTNLTINQCGLPKTMVLEMFRPFVINKLLELEYAPNIRVAKQIIDDEEEVVWDILAELIKDRPVMLNRAPTLHKQGIQAFFATLVEGDAIRICPLVCSSYNADFDGDTMSVYIPLSKDAVAEVEDKMLAQNNIVALADSSIWAIPSKDMNIGHYLLTQMDEKSEVTRTFSNQNKAVAAYDVGQLALDTKIRVSVKGKIEETSIGRIIFNESMPESYPFVNKVIDKSSLSDLIRDIVRRYPLKDAIEVLDKLKELGFKYATEMGYDIAVEDFMIDINREEVLAEGDQKELKLQEDYMMGLLTYDEKKQLSIDMWNEIFNKLSDAIWEKIDTTNPVYQQVKSGAGKYPTQTAAVVAMKGMMRDPEGNWVELPIKGNHTKGLSAFEFFTASRGARKGLADTALRTASSGYLTRKLVDVAQDLIVRTDDCGFKGTGHTIVRDDDMLNRRVPFIDLIAGRWTSKEVLDPKTKKPIVGENEEITFNLAREIADAGVQSVEVRSPLTCQSPLGLCAKCYGYDMGDNKLIGVGKAVGVIAAQAMGEPATQMVLRTFHAGGALQTDITRGLPRLTELFEARHPKKAAFVMPFDGKIKIIEQEDGSFSLEANGEKDVTRRYYLNNVEDLMVKSGDKVKEGEVLFANKEKKEQQAPYAGTVKIFGNVLEISGRVPAFEEFTIMPTYKILVNSGDELKAGKVLTDGSIDPRTYLEAVNLLNVLEYVIDGVQSVYTEQGISMNDKHVECIVRQMGKMAKVIDSGDSSYLIGSFVNKFIAQMKNIQLESMGKKPAFVIDNLLGITAASLKTESFLSAMSFQEQVRVLTEAAIIGKTDYLRGLKENVIIGRPIPVGESARITDFSELEEIAE